MENNGPLFHKVNRLCVFEVSRVVGIARFESVSESQNTMPLRLQVPGLGAAIKRPQIGESLSSGTKSRTDERQQNFPGPGTNLEGKELGP